MASVYSHRPETERISHPSKSLSNLGTCAHAGTFGSSRLAPPSKAAQAQRVESGLEGSALADSPRCPLLGCGARAHSVPDFKLGTAYDLRPHLPSTSSKQGYFQNDFI